MKGRHHLLPHYSTLGARGRDKRQVRRSRALRPAPPCARLSHPARPTHRFRRLALPTLRLHASQLPHHIVHSCAGARFCPFTSITSTRVEGGASRRRGSGAAAAAWPSRTVRALGCPGGGEGGGCCGASPRQQAWAKAGGLTFFGVVTCFFCVRHFIAVLRSCSERTIRDVLEKKTEEGKTQRQPARGDIGHAGSGRLGATRGGSDPPVVILILLRIVSVRYMAASCDGAFGLEGEDSRADDISV